MLAQPGDRAVLGPSIDGGYYLLGVKQPHRRLFEDIAWSTEQVARQTLERAAEIGLRVHVLPPWYDVDDASSLDTLQAELCGRSAVFGGPAGRIRRRTPSGCWARCSPAPISPRRLASAGRALCDKGRRMMRKTGLDWQLLALGGILLALTVWGAFTVVLLDDKRAGHVTLIQAPFYALAAWLVVTRPPQEQGRALLAILALALAMRVLLLPGTPVSTDIFRYVWDGRVQARRHQSLSPHPGRATRCCICATPRSIRRSTAPTTRRRSTRR